MSRRNTISEYKHTIGICLGIIASLAILASETCYYNYLANETTVKKEINHDNDEANHDILTINKDAVASAAQLAIIQVLHFISDIYLDDTNVDETVVDQKVDFNTYFKALFRLIISPNAP